MARKNIGGVRMEKLTATEIMVLQKLKNEGFEWLARDSADGYNGNSTLISFKKKPKKNNRSGSWDSSVEVNASEDYTENISINLFDSIHWSDSEPKNIAQLLNIKEDKNNDEFNSIRD